MTRELRHQSCERKWLCISSINTVTHYFGGTGGFIILHGIGDVFFMFFYWSMECLRLWNTKFKTFRKTSPGTIPLTSCSLSSHEHECRRHPHEETNHETAITILMLGPMTRRQHLIWARLIWVRCVPSTWRCFCVLCGNQTVRVIRCFAIDLRECSRYSFCLLFFLPPLTTGQGSNHSCHLLASRAVLAVLTTHWTLRCLQAESVQCGQSVITPQQSETRLVNRGHRS